MFTIFTYYLSDPATYTMESIVFFFRDTLGIIYGIGFFVFWVLFRCIGLFLNQHRSILNTRYRTGRYFFRKMYFYTIGVKHYANLEFIWTVVPALVLIIVGIPSFSLLYFIEEYADPQLVLKAEGHQWYWHYHLKGSDPYLPDVDTSFDSYMIPTESLKSGQLRLLEVDRKLCLPINMHIQVIATSVDVLHCWGVPSLGIKLDCCPGRLNESMLYLRRTGVFYGQCSEICGMNHAFMPIVVRAQTPFNFIWFDGYR